jgi:hypothetical protein
MQMLLDLLQGKKDKGSNKADGAGDKGAKHDKPVGGADKGSGTLGDGKLTGSDFDQVMEDCLKGIHDDMSAGKPVDKSKMEMLKELKSMKGSMGSEGDAGSAPAGDDGGKPSKSKFDHGGVAGIMSKLQQSLAQISPDLGSNKMFGGEDDEEQAKA